MTDENLVVNPLTLINATGLRRVRVQIIAFTGSLLSFTSLPIVAELSSRFQSSPRRSSSVRCASPVFYLFDVAAVREFLAIIVSRLCYMCTERISLRPSILAQYRSSGEYSRHSMIAIISQTIANRKIGHLEAHFNRGQVTCLFEDD